MDGDGCVSRVSGVVGLVGGYMSGGGGSMGCRGRKVGRGGERGGAQRTERAKPFFVFPPPSCQRGEEGGQGEEHQEGGQRLDGGVSDGVPGVVGTRPRLQRGERVRGQSRLLWRQWCQQREVRFAGRSANPCSQ